MTSAKEIYEYINSFAPFETAMSFDNVGILVGDEMTGTDRVLVTLDATPDSIREAQELNAKIIVTHHPVIFDPIKVLDSKSVVYLAAKAGITIISAHTNLDTARGGVNDTLAEAIGIKAEKFLDEHCMLIGEFDREMNCTELAESIKEKLQLSGMRFTDCGRKIKRAAVACGAGGSNIEAARSFGADALITGEIKHNYIVYGNSYGIAVFDLGHYGSEKLIIPRLVKMLSEQFSGTEFIRAQSDTDGLIYI